MRVYVASSWRCMRQPTVVRALRRAGHVVYDFKSPAPEVRGFHWRECASPSQLKDPTRFRSEVLPHTLAQRAFDFDISALRAAKATVLVLPCGRSAHLELGYAVGAGQRTIVLFDSKIDEPELMYLMCSKLCVTLDEVIKELELE